MERKIAFKKMMESLGKVSPQEFGKMCKEYYLEFAVSSVPSREALEEIFDGGVELDKPLFWEVFMNVPTSAINYVSSLIS